MCFRIGSGFVAGLGRLQHRCGAVTGAVAVIGLRFGYVSGEDKASKDKTIETVRRFMARFEEKHGSSLCRELLGADITTPEGLADAQNRNLFHKVCRPYIKDAALLLEDLLK